MTYQFHCKECQSNFLVEQQETETVYTLNGHTKLMAYCPECQIECEMDNSGGNQEQDFDEFMEDLRRQFGPGCGGGCSCG